MTWNHVIQRMGLAVILLGMVGLTAGQSTEKIEGLKSLSPTVVTKVLYLPSDQHIGILSIVAEPGARMDPKRVCLSHSEAYLGIAQGKVNVPADRDICLSTSLPLSRTEEAKIRAENPHGYQMLVTDAVQKNPFDLSGLSGLDPNDLYMLQVHRAIRNTDADQRVLEPISRLTGLRALSLNTTGVTDAGMEKLRSFQALQALNLSQELSVKNQGLAVLKDLPALEFLDLDTGTTDAGFQHIGQISNLRWLRIRTGRIWGPGLAELANLPNLERLCIWGTAVISDRHIVYLESLSGLRSLTLWGCADRLTDASLASIGKLTNLEELYFIRTNPRFTASGLAHLKHLKKLRIVDFGQISVDDAGVTHLTALANLERIEGGLFVTAKGMKTLGSLPNLKALHVGIKGPIQGNHDSLGIAYLAGLDALEELSIINAEVSDTDLLHIEPLKNLRHLAISGSGITDRGLASIAKLNRLDYLDLRFVDVTKQGLNQLRSLTDLKFLRVTSSPERAYTIDETTLDLSSMRNLEQLRLTHLSLDEMDVASLANLSRLKELTIETHSLPGDSLRSLANLSSLRSLTLDGILCVDNSLAHLNALSHLSRLMLRGQISETALLSLNDLPCLWSLTVYSTEPIRRQSHINLTEHLAGIEYIHVYRKPSTSQPGAPEIQPTRPNKRRR